MPTEAPPTTTTAPPAHRPLTFLALPPEIRNAIYHLLLTHNHAISAPSYHQLSPTTPTPLNIHPALLRTCTQIHTEALPILYGSNRFQAHPSLLTGMTFALDATRPIISARVVALIRRFHLRVRLDCDPNYGEEALVRAFSGVEELQVEVFQASYGNSDFRVLELFKGIRGVGRARVFGSVAAEFAGWLEGCMESEVGAGVGVGGWVGEGFGGLGEREKVLGGYEVWVHGGR